MQLTSDQTDALHAFSAFLMDPNEKYLIIQGSAGSGKSTLIEYLDKALEAQFQMYALLLRQDPKESDFEFVLTVNTCAYLYKTKEMYCQTLHVVIG